MVYSDDTKQPKIPRVTKTLVGAFCGMIATVMVHPFDLVKVRMQVFPSGRSTIEMTKRILRCEGFSALYVGVTAGLLRQATYTTTRLGVYYWLYDEYRKYGIPSLPDKMVIGAYAGMAGAFAGTPSEVVLVRMMADGKRDPCSTVQDPKRYRGAFDAMYKITCSEGFFALWRGGMLTLARSVFVGIAQIGTYTKVRSLLLERNLAAGPQLHIYTSVVSSFFTAILTLPVDLVKTRYQLQRKGGTNMTQAQVFEDIMKDKGIRHFWKGFLPYFIRLSAHTVFTFFILEECNQIIMYYRTKS